MDTHTKDNIKTENDDDDDDNIFGTFSDGFYLECRYRHMLW